MRKASQSKLKAAVSGREVNDIPHQVVANNGALAVVPQILTEEQVISNEIQKFKTSDASIQAMYEQFEALEIAGPDDKEGYKKVKEAWNEVRSTRTGLEKTGLDLRRRFNAITKGISKEETRLTDKVTTLEDKLYERWKKIDDAKEAEKAAKEKAEQDRLLERIKAITAEGMREVDGFFEIGGTISVDVATLRAMDEAKFSKFFETVSAKADELAKVAELEAEKRQREKEEFEKQQREFSEMKAAAEKQQAELQKLREEAQQLTRQNRGEVLKGLGFVYVGGCFRMYLDADLHGGARVYVETLDLPADEWAIMLETITREAAIINEANAKYKADKEKAEKERAHKEQRIAEIMNAAGIPYDLASRSFAWKNEFYQFVPTPMGELLDERLDILEGVAQEWGKNINEAKEKQEQARQAALSDEVNMLEYVEKLLLVPFPKLTTKDIEVDRMNVYNDLIQLRAKYEQK